MGRIDTCDARCRRAAFWNMQRRPVVQTVGIPCVQPLMLRLRDGLGCRGLLLEGGLLGLFGGVGGWKAWGRGRGGDGMRFRKCGCGVERAPE
jgi:hypothetical protein